MTAPALAGRFGHGRRHPARPRCYNSDTTDAEWQVIASVLPWRAWLADNGGRPEEYCRRLIVDAIFYVADNVNKWRDLPGGFPHRQSVIMLMSRRLAGTKDARHRK